jgi:uncharacterized protein YjbI with pentapeptide repeats
MLRTVWQRTGFAGKTLGDWLQLLIVPLVLALAAFALNAAQADRDREQDVRQAAQERRVAEDRAREDALRSYLQQISDLITDHGLSSASHRGTGLDVRTLARTLTVTTLRRLDAERKSLVLRFLLEGDLITGTTTWLKSPDGRVPIETRLPQVSLAGADLQGVAVPRFLQRRTGPNARGQYEVVAASFQGADLRDADFRETHLNGVSLLNADLSGADFRQANLRGADFRFACISRAQFARITVGERGDDAYTVDFAAVRGRDVDFSGADLTDATFVNARLTEVNLESAKTTRTRWPRGWTDTGLKEARGADCSTEGP